MLQRRSLSRPDTDDEMAHSQRSTTHKETSEDLSSGGFNGLVATRLSSPISLLPPEQEQGFTLNPPNDQYEREADRVSQQIMSVPDGEIDALIAPKLRIQRLTSTNNTQVPSRNEAGAENQSTSAELAPPVPSDVDAGIRRAVGGGKPLAVSDREFFEPRFGHDFGKVRIHCDSQAASLASAVDASAFTIGRNIFFNSGYYQPSSPSGRQLLAHELTHVVQQGSAAEASQVLQRAKILYVDLVWGDFKGKVPARSTFAAETSTEIGTFQHTVPKPDVEDTKNPCKIGKKDSSEFTATVSIDPDMFDGVVPFMVQEKSWVRDRYRDDGHAHCVGVAKDCEAFFVQAAANAKKLCLKQVAACQKDFKQNTSSVTFTIDGNSVVVSSKAECATTLLQKCQEFAMQNSPFTLHADKEPDFLKVDSKKECKTQAFEQCAPHEKQESQRLLKHEQGHFDITKVMAENLRAALKSKAAELTATANKCGRQQAIDAALKAFNALKPWQVLDKIYKDGTKQWKKAQDAYDKETNHGLKKEEQDAWEKDILDGLKKFVPGDDTPPDKDSAKKERSH